MLTGTVLTRWCERAYHVWVSLAGLVMRFFAIRS
jgi:hypothetical protein